MDDGSKVQYASRDTLEAKVFKTVADPFVGKLSYIKIVNGTLAAGTEVVNRTTGNLEKPGKLLSMQGKKTEDMIEAYAGDIVAQQSLVQTRAIRSLRQAMKRYSPQKNTPFPASSRLSPQRIRMTRAR